jgi:hypothetical protein
VEHSLSNTKDMMLAGSLAINCILNVKGTGDRGLYHSGSILLQFVVITHKAFLGVIFDVPEFICHIVSSILMHELVV